MRVLLRQPAVHEGGPWIYYQGRDRHDARWTTEDKQAWDFGTVLTAESIRERDRYLQHCEVVEMR